MELVDVPVRRLDDCLAEWKVDRVDLLKIDVEGHEGKVFAGAERPLASGPDQGDPLRV